MEHQRGYTCGSRGINIKDSMIKCVVGLVCLCSHILTTVVPALRPLTARGAQSAPHFVEPAAYTGTKEVTSDEQLPAFAKCTVTPLYNTIDEQWQ